MDVEILTIGDELLLGQVVDTNSAWMGAELSKEGFHVSGITTVGDDAKEITAAVDRLLKRSSIVLVTGGLGPTNDDITLQVLCDYFDSKLVFSQEVYADIERFFAGRPGSMNRLNHSQAMVPDNAVVIANRVGTAPITWFDRGGKVLVSMPGVPVEMKTVMSNEIIPRLKSHFQVPFIQHRHVMVTDYSESALALELEEWEKSLPASIRLAYLPQVGLVRLRLTASSNKENELALLLDGAVEKIKPILGKHIFALEDIAPEALIGRLLCHQNWTMSTAESCTGGYIAHLITSISGSSQYFKGSVVAYSNEVKQHLLGVSATDLDSYGAVSCQVVEQMVKGAQRSFDTDVAVATSGVAGPTGGSDEKPVGTVWIAVAVKSKIVSQRFQFGQFRDRNIVRAALMALTMLKQELDA